MQLTEPEPSTVSEIDYAKQRLRALPQTANVIQAISVLDQAQHEYSQVLAAVNAVETRITEYEGVAQQAAFDRQNKIGAMPAPDGLARWSSERQRLQLLIKDTGDIINMVIDQELTPARDALAAMAVNIRATLSQVAGVEYTGLAAKIDSGQELTAVEQRRLMELRIAAVSTPSFFNEPVRQTAQPVQKW